MLVRNWLLLLLARWGTYESWSMYTMFRVATSSTISATAKSGIPLRAAPGTSLGTTTLASTRWPSASWMNDQISLVQY